MSDPIAALLGQILHGRSQGGPVFQMPTVTGTPGINPDSQEMQGTEEIGAKSTPFPPSKYREGIVRGGPFAMGHLGGNILGALGDAFLAQGGAAAQYAPRLREAREAEALQNYSTDPVRAMQQYGMIDPHGMVDMIDKYQDNLRQQAVANSTIQGGRDKYESDTHRLVGGLLHAANPKTWQAIRKRINDIYSSRKVDPLIDIPEKYNPMTADSYANAYVPADVQSKLDAADAYHDALMGYRYTAEGGRNARAEAANRVRQSEGNANREVRQSEGNANREVRVEEGNSNREVSIQQGNANRAVRREGIATTQRRDAARIQKFTPDPNKVYVQGGKKYKYVDGKFVEM